MSMTFFFGFGKKLSVLLSKIIVFTSDGFFKHCLYSTRLYFQLYKEKKKKNYTIIYSPKDVLNRFIFKYFSTDYKR